MANNELDLYSGGGIQPYHGGEVAPAPDWGTPDLLRDSTESYTGGGQMVLGQQLPAGVSIREVTEAYQQLGNVFAQDFMRLGHNITQTQKCVSWFMNAIQNPPALQQKRHSYNLYEHTNDPIFQAFANYAHDNGFSAKMVSDCCWWVSEASHRLAAQQVGSKPMPRKAPTNSDPTENLTEQQWEWVVKANQAAALKTEITLRHKWGDTSYAQNIQVAQKYLNSLPANERKHFDRYTTGWIHSLNTVEVLEFLFNSAIGAGNIPKAGSDVQAEINQIEDLMRTPATRHAYMKDSQLQARLRTLYDIRDKR